MPFVGARELRAADLGYIPFLLEEETVEGTEITLVCLGREFNKILKIILQDRL